MRSITGRAVHEVFAMAFRGVLAYILLRSAPAQSDFMWRIPARGRGVLFAVLFLIPLRLRVQGIYIQNLKPTQGRALNDLCRQLFPAKPMRVKLEFWFTETARDPAGKTSGFAAIENVARKDVSIKYIHPNGRELLQAGQHPVIAGYCKEITMPAAVRTPSAQDPLAAMSSGNRRFPRRLPDAFLNLPKPPRTRRFSISSNPASPGMGCRVLFMGPCEALQRK